LNIQLSSDHVERNFHFHQGLGLKGFKTYLDHKKLMALFLEQHSRESKNSSKGEKDIGGLPCGP